MLHFHGGKHVRAWPPHLIFNSDNKMDYTCNGKQLDSSSKVSLVSTALLVTKDILSVHHHKDSNNLNCLRAKRRFLSNAAGDVTPACIYFGNLKENEMPDDDFILWEIEGLCVSGYGAGLSNGIGFVLFMKGGEGSKKKRF